MRSAPRSQFSRASNSSPRGTEFQNNWRDSKNYLPRHPGENSTTAYNTGPSYSHRPLMWAVPQSAQPSYPNRPYSSVTTSPASFGQDSERQYRREKGLCFKCGEQFMPGHRCKTSTLRLMEITDETEESTELVEEEN